MTTATRDQIAAINQKALEALRRKGWRDDVTDYNRDDVLAYQGRGKVDGNEEGLGQFFTHSYIAGLLYRFAFVRPEHRILDNSAGTGNLVAPHIDQHEPYSRRKIGVAMIEVDETCVRILQARWPDLERCIMRGDASTFQLPDATFDRALINPPFGLHFSGRYVVDMETTDPGSQKTLSHAYLFEQAVRAVKPAGIIGAIVPRNFFENTLPAEMRLRKWLAANTWPLARIDMPASAFAAAGTEWPTSIMVVQRRFDVVDEQELVFEFRDVVDTMPWSVRHGRTLDQVWFEYEPKLREIVAHRQAEVVRRANQVWFAMPARERQYPAPYLPAASRSVSGIERKRMPDPWHRFSLDVVAGDDTVYLSKSAHYVNVRTRSAYASLMLQEYMGGLFAKRAQRAYSDLNEDPFSIRLLVQKGDVAVRHIEDEIGVLGLRVQFDPGLVNHINQERHQLSFRLCPREVPAPQGFARWSVVPAEVRPAFVNRVPDRIRPAYLQAGVEIDRAIAALQARGMTYDPWPYQLHGATLALTSMGKRGGFMLADEPGVAKTVQVLLAAWAMLRRAAPYKKIVVVAPSRLIQMVWHEGFESMGLGDEFCEIRSWTAADRENIKKARRARFHLVPYEALAGVSTWGLHRILRQRFRYIAGIADESTYLKNAKSKRSRAVEGLGVPRWLLMSAGPDEIGTDDLWNQFRLAFGPGHAFFQSAIPSEKDRYMRQHAEVRTVRNGALVNQPGVLELNEVQDQFAAISIRRQLLDPEVDEYMPVPPPNFHVVELHPDSAEKEFYAVMHEKARDRMDLVEASRRKLSRYSWRDEEEAGKWEERARDVAGNKITDLRQSASAPWLWPDLWKGGYNSVKTRWLIATARERLARGEKGVIVTCHLGALGGFLLALRKEFGSGAVQEVRGGQIKRTNRVIAQFEEDPNLKLLVCSMRAIQYGINQLTHSHFMVIADHDWAPEVERQMWGRLVRKGQDKNIDVYWLSLLETCDEHMDATFFWRSCEGADRKDRGFFSKALIKWGEAIGPRMNMSSGEIGHMLSIGSSREYDLRRDGFLARVKPSADITRINDELEALDRQLQARGLSYAGREELQRRRDEIVAQARKVAETRWRETEDVKATLDKRAEELYREARKAKFEAPPVAPAPRRPVTQAPRPPARLMPFQQPRPMAVGVQMSLF